MPDVADKRKTQTNTRTCKTQSPSKLKCCREMSKHDQAAVYHRGKIFDSASSASVPTQICLAVERMCRLKDPLQPLVPGVSHITGEFGRIAEQKVPCNPTPDGVNSLKYRGAWSAARTKDILLCVCVEGFYSQSLLVIWEGLSCSIGACSVISDEDWNHFPLSLSPRLRPWRRQHVDFRPANIPSLLQYYCLINNHEQCVFLLLSQNDTPQHSLIRALEARIKLIYWFGLEMDRLLALYSE